MQRIPFDKNDPNRVQRWIEWLDSPYWTNKVRKVSPSVIQEELDTFEDAMRG